MINIGQATTCAACKRKCNAFKLLTKEELLHINQHRFETHFEPSDIIFKQGMPSSGVAIIAAGIFKMEIQHGHTGNLILGIEKGPALIGTPGMFTDNKYHYSLVALTALETCIIDTDIIKATIKSNSDFAEQFIAECSRRSIYIYQRAISLTLKHMHGKLAETLLFFANEIYNANTFSVPLTRQELANYTGITKESVSRILKQFKDENIIDFKMSHFKILDKAKLELIREHG